MAHPRPASRRNPARRNPARRENPTPIRVEFEALMASIRRRYGDDPLKAIAINPVVYKERMGERMLARGVRNWIGKPPGGVSEDVFGDINQWAFGVGEYEREMKMEGGTLTMATRSNARGSKGDEIFRLGEALSAVLLLTSADAQKIARLAMRVLAGAPFPSSRGEADWLADFVNKIGPMGGDDVDAADEYPDALHDLFEGAEVKGADNIGSKNILWIPWAWPDGMCWTLTTTVNRLQKAERAKAKLTAVSYDADLASGFMTYDWPGDEAGERWWVYDIPTGAELKVDGTIMGHCTKDPQHWHQSDLDNGKAKFYSLRREVDGLGERVATTKVLLAEQFHRRVRLNALRGLAGTALEARTKNNMIPGFPYHDPEDVLELEGLSEDGKEVVDRLCQFYTEFQFAPPPELMPALLLVSGNSGIERLLTHVLGIWRPRYDTMVDYVVNGMVDASVIGSSYKVPPRSTRKGRRQNPGDAASVADMIRDLLAVPAFTQT